MKKMLGMSTMFLMLTSQVCAIGGNGFFQDHPRRTVVDEERGMSWMEQTVAVFPVNENLQRELIEKVFAAAPELKTRAEGFYHSLAPFHDEYTIIRSLVVHPFEKKSLQTDEQIAESGGKDYYEVYPGVIGNRFCLSANTIPSAATCSNISPVYVSVDFEEMLIYGEHGTLIPLAQWREEYARGPKQEDEKLIRESSAPAVWQQENRGGRIPGKI